MPRATSVKADNVPASGEVKRGASAFTGNTMAAIAKAEVLIIIKNFRHLAKPSLV